MDDSSKLTDSAGVPWEGRSFGANPFEGDDGSADPALLEAITNFKNGLVSASDVVEAFSNARLLVPLVANLGESEVGEHGLKIDKSAELSIVTVQAPDGQPALPVFSSVEAMSIWNPNARPVPNNARAIALAAASEGNTRIVLDPLSPTEFVIRRPAIAAIAQALTWESPEGNIQVQNLVLSLLERYEVVDSFSLASGDPQHNLSGQELIIEIYLQPGLSEELLAEFEKSFFSQLSTSQVFIDLVDSVAVKFLPAS